MLVLWREPVLNTGLSDELGVDTPENLLQLQPDVSVDDHVEAGVDQAVQVGENDHTIFRRWLKSLQAYHEDNSIGPPAHQESWR